MKFFNLFKKKTISSLNDKYEVICSLFKNGGLTEVWIESKSGNKEHLKTATYKKTTLEEGIQLAIEKNKPIYLLTSLPRDEELIMLDYFLNLGGNLNYFDGKTER